MYGVPKAHKRPVRMRPIVPCHSVAQAPCATYVSKQLKELIARQPHVLKGSKDLVQKLSKLRLDPGRKVYIISGDIVAFYPNIPLQKCLSIVSKMYRETPEWQELSKEERHLFLTCFQAANRDLVIDFEHESAVQIRGLAMGIACSPDLANLYGAFFENPILSSERYKAKVGLTK